MNHDAQVGLLVVLSWKEQTRNYLQLINIFFISNKLIKTL